MLLSWLLIGYLWYKQLIDYWPSFIIYWLLRPILFNYCHNIAAWKAIKLKLDKLYKRSAKWYEVLFYLGDVSEVDKIVAWLSFGQWWLILLFQAICGVFVYFILTGKI